jgi:hypothetical protein
VRRWSTPAADACLAHRAQLLTPASLTARRTSERFAAAARRTCGGEGGGHYVSSQCMGGYEAE